MGGRINIKTWLAEMNIPGAQVDVIDAGGRGSPSTGGYWETMKKAQIVAHANPGNWEGDFRLWESLCSKALVFVDYMYIPHPHPLIDGEDVVFFDPLDRQGFVDKINYYLEHKDEARRIAMNGFYKAIKYHRYINRVDYFFNTINLLTDPAYKVRNKGILHRTLRLLRCLVLLVLCHSVFTTLKRTLRVLLTHACLVNSFD